MKISVEAAKNYYYEKDAIMERLTQEDNTIKQSFWYGNLAENLGLEEFSGVKKEDFDNLLTGKNLKGEKIIKSSSSKQEDRAGEELHFGSPKSVSIYFAFANSQEQTRIVKAQQQAAINTLEKLQNEYINYRTTNNKRQEIRHSNKLIASVYTHTTNRENEMQLHIHAQIMNMTVDNQGNFKAIHTDELYRNKALINAIYQNELRKELEKIGLKTEDRENGLFELKNFIQKLNDAFSERTKQINEYIEKNNLENTEEARQIAALATRTKKDKDITEEKLKNQWNETIDKNNLKDDLIKFINDVNVEKNTQIKTHLEEEIKEAIKTAINIVHDKKAYFSKNDVHKVFAKAYSNMLTRKEFEEKFEVVIAEYTNLQAENLKSNNTIEKLYTSKEYKEIEDKVIKEIKDSKDTKEAFYSKEEAEKIIKQFEREKNAKLTEDQKNFVTAALTTKNGILGVQGDAGTGKSFSIEVIKYALDKKDIEIIGLGSTGKASDVIKDTITNSTTIHKFLMNKDNENTNTNNVDRAKQIDKANLSNRRKNGSEFNFVDFKIDDVKLSLDYSKENGLTKTKEIKEEGLLTTKVTKEVKHKNGISKTEMKIKGDKIERITHYKDKKGNYQTINEFKSSKFLGITKKESVFKIYDKEGNLTKIIEDKQTRFGALYTKGEKIEHDLRNNTKYKTNYSGRDAFLSNELVIKKSETKDITHEDLKKADNLKIEKSETTKEQQKQKLIIIDENSMTDVKTFSKLLDAAKDDNAKIITLGDKKQHQAVNAGNVQNLVDKYAETVKLTTNFRQKNNEVLQESVTKLARAADTRTKAEMQEAVKNLEEKGFIKQTETAKADAVNKAVELIKQDKTVAIATATNKEADAVNKAVREKLFDTSKDYKINVLNEKKINDEDKKYVGSYKVGDKISFSNENSKVLIKSKDITVKAVDKETNIITVHALDKKDNSLLVKKIDIKKFGQDLNIYEVKELGVQKSDALLFLKNENSENKYKNGQSGKVIEINEKEEKIKVAFEKDKVIEIAKNELAHVQHGYSATSQKFQGDTKDYFIAIDSKSSNHAYVDITRAKENSYIFTDDIERTKNNIINKTTNSANAEEKTFKEFQTLKERRESIKENSKDSNIQKDKTEEKTEKQELQKEQVRTRTR